MKVLLTLLLLVILALGAYLLMGPGDGSGDGTGTADPGGSSASHATHLPQAIRAPNLDFQEDQAPLGDLAEKDLAKIDRSGWPKFRNPLEQRVPDPDGIGPCPPPQLGGRPNLVVRRFRDWETGDRIWMHEDGSMTWHHYERGKDPGRKEVIGRWIISTAVPTESTRAEPGSTR